MNTSVTTIPLQMPLGLGVVNCYLIQSDLGFILVDTGSSNQRSRLVGEMERCGCVSGKLALILITHGDFDHTGNAAYLREYFGAKIGMHPGDVGMAERGDMFWNRKKGNAVIRFLAPRLFRFGADNCFSPDLLVDESFDLAENGLNGRLLHLPGHSLGSIGLWLTGCESNGGNALLCGDLLENTKAPALNAIMDDLPAACATLEKLNRLEIESVYAGHGSAWKWSPIQIPVI